MKTFFKGAVAGVLALLVIGAASRATYKGVFVGDGTGLTNVTATASGGSAVYVTTSPLTNKVSAANITVGTVASVFDGAAITNLGAANLAVGGVLPVLDGGSLTNIITSSTNAEYAVSALYATNDPAGTAISMASKAASTNASIVNTIIVAALNAQDPVVATVRASSIQATNNVFEVENSAMDVLFGVNASGSAVIGTNELSTWPAAPTAGGQALLVNSNGTIYLLTSIPFTATWAATNQLAP